MFSTLTSLALVASLIPNVFAQTPNTFNPGTLVNLGVAFPSINIDPVGSSLQSLDQAQSEPVISAPMSVLAGRNGQNNPNQRFMVMMIDIDVVQNNVGTTVLHWFQPNLALEAQSQGAIAPPSAPGSNKSAMLDKSMAATVVRLVKAPKQDAITGAALPPNPIGQADYIAPAPPPGSAHRYVQVLFAQPANFSVPACFQNVLSTPGNATANGQRLGFDINQFLAATGVQTQPIAGNFFRAQNAQPGPLVSSPVSTQLVNAMCPGVTIPGVAAGAAKFRRWIG